MRIDVLTLFPEVFETYLETSIIGRARSSGILEVVLTQIRDFATDKHRRVDDRPFGGGPGMVMMCPPLFDCVEQVESAGETPHRILLSPQGRPLSQERVAELADKQRLLLICGHYEGFDERIRLGLNAEEVSIGDYVLSGGELPALVLIDAVTRLLPGALGDDASAENDSFSRGLLDHPQYTRPREFNGMEVPEILLSGDHAKIELWRREQSQARTRERRPELLADSTTDPEPGAEP